MKSTYKYTEEQLIKAVKQSLNYAQVCRNLGIRHSSGNSYERVRNKIQSLGLDTSHFLGYKTKAGLRNEQSFKRKSLDLVLIANVSNRQSHKILRNAMIDSGIVYSCKECTISTWRGKKLTLDIDHIDGDWSNCILGNLRFLCPNCHRQTNTFGNTKRNTGVGVCASG